MPHWWFFFLQTAKALYLSVCLYSIFSSLLWENLFPHKYLFQQERHLSLGGFELCLSFIPPSSISKLQLSNPARHHHRASVPCSSPFTLLFLFPFPVFQIVSRSHFFNHFLMSVKAASQFLDSIIDFISAKITVDGGGLRDGTGEAWLVAGSERVDSWQTWRTEQTHSEGHRLRRETARRKMICPSSEQHNMTPLPSTSSMSISIIHCHFAQRSWYERKGCMLQYICNNFLYANLLDLIDNGAVVHWHLEFIDLWVTYCGGLWCKTNTTLPHRFGKYHNLS